MATLPGNIVGDIEWFEERLPSWAENPPAIGLTAEQVVELTTETAEARSTYEAANAAKTAAKNASVTQNTQVSEMRSVGGQAITIIRAFAQTQPDPNAVLTLASVPPKQAPSSVPPEQPYEIDFDLTDTGEIKLKWKGSTAGGTVFTVSRSVKSEPNQPFGPQQQVAIIGAREFIDSTIPACSVAAAYVITAYKGSFAPAVSKVATVLFTPGGESAGQTFSIAA